MIEPEIAFADLSDNAALAETLLKYTFAAFIGPLSPAPKRNLWSDDGACRPRPTIRDRDRFGGAPMGEEDRGGRAQLLGAINDSLGK